MRRRDASPRTKKRTVKSKRPVHRNVLHRAVSPVRQAPSELRQVAIDAIDWSLAIRSINDDHVDRLAGAAKLPPIKVWEYQRGQYRGVDGYHRWNVAKTRGDKNIVVVLCHFPTGNEGQRAFDVECIRSNIGHGLPLTKGERDRAIKQFWSRWGRSDQRPEGQTLDEIGKLFAVTKQRVHQILAGAASFSEDESRGQTFSSFGRFSAATKRMSTLLSDATFLERLIHDRQTDVLNALRELSSLIERVLSHNA